MPLDHEIQTLRALLDSGERDGCARALADLRDRYRLQPTAFDPRAIQALRDIAEALNRNEEDRPLAKLALRPPRAPDNMPERSPGMLSGAAANSDAVVG